MCGIAGFISFKDFPSNAETIISNMTQSLKHRGPDDFGIYIDKKWKTALGHTRLSIIDLSNLGHQPMMENDSLVVCFNGEIYNFIELKNLLVKKGYNFFSKSDTEVILKSYIEWDTNCFEKFEGMWAIALLDRRKGKLILSRDRAGEKPLYFYRNEHIIAFASEVKALLCHPQIEKKVDKEACELFFQLQYIPSPKTIYKNISQILPSHNVIVSLLSNKVLLEKYWNVQNDKSKKIINKIEGNILDEYKFLLEESVKKRLISDVPVGIFLSGGIDSSLITCGSVAIGHNPIKTFTIGFTDKKYDETYYAKKVSNILGTEHNEWILTQKEMFEAIEEYENCYDMPFADESAIPVILLSKMTKEHVKVALGGDGGDELFGGYSRYQRMLLYKKFDSLPFSFKLFLKTIFKKMPNEKIKKITNILECKDIADIYSYIIGVFKFYELESLFVKRAVPLYIKSIFNEIDIKDFGNKLTLLDFFTYLPDLVLTKVDRASMHFGLEVRAPFLDSQLIRFSRKINGKLKIGKNRKAFSRALLEKYGIPKDIINRPKKGFGAPLEKWLLNIPKEKIESLFNLTNLSNQNVLNADFVIKIKNRFFEGNNNYKIHFWTLYIFLQWIQKWKPEFE